MRARAVWCTAVLVVGFLGLAPGLAQQEPLNLLRNGGFEDGVTTPWGIHGGSTMEAVKQCAGAVVPEGPIEGKYCLHVTAVKTASWWDTAISQNGGIFQKGKKYTLSAYLKCKSGTAQVNFKPELGVDPWTGYGEQQMTITDTWAEYSITTPVFSADTAPTSITFHIGFAAAEFWMDSVRFYEGDYAPPAFLGQFSADSPTPAKDATDVPRDAALSWEPGPFADTHNVFLGTTFDDVNNATVAKPLGVLAGKGLKVLSLDPAGLLAYGTTYYWRVDEVNAPPDSTVYKGHVWSFTTEPYSYPVTSVTATASSSSQDMGPSKTTDGSGLSANGEHSTTDAAMWLSAPGTALPAWISYAFDQPYILRQMKVWNSNRSIEPYLGFGAKDVLIEYSLDGTTWTAMGNVEFAQADGSDTYTGFTVEMHDVQARFVRLTINSGWGYTGFVGLSEVRFQYIPVQAREPIPATYAEGVPVDSTLDWREGRLAASHKVYFGTDKAKVADGSALVDTTTASFYQPPLLNFGTLYYWKVDEVNSATASDYPGNLWAFTTTEFTDIDNFESYTNESPHRVFQTWIDGWGFSKDEFFPTGDPGNGTGAMVGYDPSVGAIMETSIAHAGQSMPIEYNNVNSPYYSEVDRTFDTPQDWTTNGATDLSLWFHGSPAAFVETASGITVSGAGADIYQGTDEFRFVYKKLTGDGSITVRLDSAQTAADWTKLGVMMRESLDPLAMQAHMISAAQQSLVEWMYRSTSNSATTTQFNTAANANPLPVWLRITRAGNVFTGECSTNGTTWTKITATDGTASSTTISMLGTVYVGVVVCSGSAGNLAVGDFSQIKTSTNITGQWQVADIGVAQPANIPDPLYLVIQDSANKTVVVKHPDGANAVLASQWTQWKIPLSQLAGVNTKAIKKMTIGVGDRSNPKAGAAGMLYIDDVQYGHPITPVGLVAYYKLEGDTLDSSGNGHDGVLAGDPNFPVAYVNGPTGFGKGMLFEGTQGHQYVDMGTFNPSEKTGRLTVALWAKWDGLSTAWQGLIGKRVGAWDRASMMWQIEANQTTGVLRFQREGNDIILQTAAPAVGQWVHIAVTFDGTTARGYINGARSVQAAFSFGTGRDAPIQFGADTLGGGNSYNGTLDEIRLYDVVLTDAEIAALAGK